MTGIIITTGHSHGPQGSRQRQCLRSRSLFQRQKPLSEVVSEAVSEVIRGHQRSSEVVSEVIRGHQ